MTFTLVYILFGIFIMLAGIVALMLTYPGPKRERHDHHRSQ